MDMGGSTLLLTDMICIVHISFYVHFQKHIDSLEDISGPKQEDEPLPLTPTAGTLHLLTAELKQTPQRPQVWTPLKPVAPPSVAGRGREAARMFVKGLGP